jgi:transcriptional regulator with XRE-family HTH domain
MPSDDAPGTLRHNLRRRREAAGITRREMAERTELDPAEILLLERAGGEPGIVTLLTPAGALGTTPESLLEGVAWDPERRCYTVEPVGAD